MPKMQTAALGEAAVADRDLRGSNERSHTIEAPTAQESQFRAAQLELFEERCRLLAARVRAGDIGFIEAVDLAASAAEWSGLAAAVGYDRCQSIMAVAFMASQRGAA